MNESLYSQNNSQKRIIMKTRLYLLLLGFVACSIFISCSNEEPVPPIELKTICKEYKYDKVFLMLNGETVSPSVNAKINFPAGQLSEADTYEARMVLETTPLWVGAEGDINKNANLLFDVDATSSSDEITFTGKTSEDACFLVDVKGTVRNDSVWLNMNYQTQNHKLKGKTFELAMSADSYLLEKLESCPEYQDTVVWNGVTYPTIDFVRESLDNIYKEYVEKTGIDSYRLTFCEDGKMDVKVHLNGSYTSLDGYYAYRFHKGYEGSEGGAFEVGKNEATRFCSDFIDDESTTPNLLFKVALRDKTYVPVSLRGIRCKLEDNSYEDRLYLELVGFDDSGKFDFSHVLGEFTKSVIDYSDRTMRLRKISQLLLQQKIADEFLFYMKEVKE